MPKNKLLEVIERTKAIQEAARKVSKEVKEEKEKQEEKGAK